MAVFPTAPLIRLSLAAVVVIAAGCSASPSAERYIQSTAAPSVTDDAASPSAAAAESAPSAAPSGSSQASASAAAQTVEASAVPDPSPAASEAAATPAAPPTRSPAAPAATPPPAKEAKKNNASVNQAVTDSILDRSKDTKATDDAQIAKLKSEIETIRSLVKELKQQTENGDAEKIKACADQIAQAWETMKDKVNAAYPDMTDFLQKKIDSLNALQTSDPFDSEAMLQLDYELYQAFRQLSDKAGD